MRFCVIGAGGAAGICAIKNCIQNNLEVVGFEQTNKIGGTWFYTDKTGKDENNLPIHSSMYKSLKTNLPKELMCFPDFPFPSQEKSFLPASDVLDYLNSYVDTFGVREKIKFHHHVVRVRPINNVWEVLVRNLINDSYDTLTFDAILVCNGHFSVPHIPQIIGQKIFKGRQVHSHDYRTPEGFVGERVLVIGAGPSGTDISQELAKKAKFVFWSHHLKAPKNVRDENIIQKSDVESLTEDGVHFKDGTFERISTVLYCTGYEFTFPFLSVDSNLSCYDNYIQPLYKHCININRPSLAIIGLIFLNCPFQTFDLQLRFALKFMTGKLSLPSRNEMLEDTARDMSERWSRGLSHRKAHSFGEGYQEIYYADLAATAKIEPIKPYVTKLYNETRKNVMEDLTTFRRYKFTIIDDENFESVLLPDNIE